jgi:hypothetical protein
LQVNSGYASLSNFQYEHAASAGKKRISNFEEEEYYMYTARTSKYEYELVLEYRYQDMYARPVPTTACGMFQLNLETIYALVVFFIIWEDNMWKVLLKS